MIPCLLAEQAPRFGVHSAVLAGRTGEIVALLLPIAIAMGWSAVEESAGRLMRPRHIAALSLAGVALVSGVAWFVLRPQPATYYRMDSDEFVYNFVTISTSQAAVPWLAVGRPDGFDWSLSHGQFLSVDSFLQHYPSEEAWPRYRDSNGNIRRDGVDELFLFYEKQIHHDARIPDDAAMLATYQRANVALGGWVDAWQVQNGQLPRFFEDDRLVVYVLHRPVTQADNQTQIFGR